MDGLRVHGGEGRKVSEVNHEIFVNPQTRGWRDDPKKLSIDERSVGLARMKKWNIWEPEIRNENKG